MNSMRRLAVICMLALGLLSAGMAQSQSRLAGLGNNTAVALLKKGLIYYIGLPLMLCLGSCDMPKHAPQSEAPVKLDTAIESQPEMVATNGSWIMMKDSNGSGVYARLPYWVGNLPSHWLPRKSWLSGRTSWFYYGVTSLRISDDAIRMRDKDNWKLVRLHDETGKIIPETLRRGLSIIYTSKDGGWDGAGTSFGSISDVSDAGVLINQSEIIDASQVVGVRIVDDPQQHKQVMFPIASSEILPYLHGTMIDSRTEINTTDVIYLLAKIVVRYTSGDVRVRVQKDYYYIQQDGDEHVFTAHEENLAAIPYGLLMMERGDFIMVKDATIVNDDEPTASSPDKE